MTANGRSGNIFGAPSWHVRSHRRPHFGTPGGEYTSQCRAAVVAGIPANPEARDTGGELELAVLNPGGMFFNRCKHDEDGKAGGTWHWPERV